MRRFAGAVFVDMQSGPDLRAAGSLLLPLLLCAACGTLPDPTSQLESVAELSQGPGNIAVTPDGRLIISQHPIYQPEIRVIELLPDGSVRPFPNAAWAAERNEQDIGLDGVLGIQADPDGIVWMLDNGRRSSRLVAWNSRDDVLHRIIEIVAPVRARGSFFNDIAIDPVNRAVYISDASARNPALVVVDLESGSARRVLENDASVMAQPIAMVIGGNTYGVGRDGQPRAQIGVDGITIDPASEWVYFGASQSTDLWRVRAADLADETLSDADLSAKVERYGDRPVCDGITIDGSGNVYITDLTGDAIGVTDTNGDYRVLHRDATLLSWPDGMAFGPDGYIYVVSNQLHLSAPFNRGKNLSQPPYHVSRFKALAPGKVGR